MKLCCITTIDLTLSSFVTEAMKQFAEEGHEVVLASAMTKDFIEKYSGTFRLIPLPMHRGMSLKDIFVMPWRFYRLFRKERFDYIQYATPNASLYASIAAWMARSPIRVYCQWGIRYVGLNGMTRRLFKMLEHLTCLLSTHICSASQKNLEYAVSEGLYPREKACIIGDGGTIGVNLGEYDISKKSKFREEIRGRYPILKDKIVFAFVGRMNRDKGFFELVEAFRQLATEREDVALLIIGPKDDQISINLGEEGIKKRTIFTGFSNEVPKMMAAADVLVHPSYREGFSMVIQQAMAMALPVVTTDIPGPSEVITPNVTGLLVKPRNASSLYLGMKQMISRHDQMEKMGMAGRLRCEEKFNRNRMLRLTYEDRMRILTEK